jgi:hypothetical protein
MRNTKTLLFVALIFTFSIFGTMSVVHATALDTTTGSVGPANTNGSSGPANTGITLMNPLQGGTSLESFLNTILSFVIRIGAIVVVLMLVYVGYLFVVAQGSDSKLTEARKALLWTIIGALILLGAQAISLGIQSTVQALSVGG